MDVCENDDYNEIKYYRKILLDTGNIVLRNEVKTTMPTVTVQI